MLANSSFTFGFYNKGKLKVFNTVNVVGIHQAIINHVILLPEDYKPAAEFIAACLHLDPSQRPLARDLVRHPWLIGADWYQDYREPIPYEQ